MSDSWTEMRLFEEAGAPEPHARMMDPPSSHLTVESLGKDTSYNWRIFTCIIGLSQRFEPREYADGSSIAVIYDAPVTDDAILVSMERVWGRRYQRNVIARQRGLLREAGWLKRVDDVIGLDTNGTKFRAVVAHIPTHAGVEAYQTFLRKQLDQ